MRVFLGRLTERRLPTTPTTADVANNGAINATGMWKSGDVLRADNGNASRLERRGTTGRATTAGTGRTLSGSMKFLLRRAATFLLLVVSF